MEGWPSAGHGFRYCRRVYDWIAADEQDSKPQVPPRCGIWPGGSLVCVWPGGFLVYSWPGGFVIYSWPGGFLVYIGLAGF